MKVCFKCGVRKVISDYYKHPAMADGHLNKCKTCTQLDVLKNRYKKIEYYTEYEKSRATLPHRVEARKVYLETEKGKHATRLGKARWVAKNPEKRKMAVKKWNDKNKEKKYAHYKLTLALKSGKLIKTPCVKCGNNKSQGHHADYSKPLEVVWLCAKCHGQEHKFLRSHCRKT